ncbi:MAG: hypothetical protein ACHQZS_03210 [Candidatus Binatales bacterium]
MLRPTLAETLSGIQRTILGTLFAELSSPYAQGQAAMAAADLTHVIASLETAPAYDAAEVADLRQTLAALKPEASSLDRPAMEAAMAELAAALALGKLDPASAETVRGYMRRYLDRTRELLKSSWGA